ncbi:hypothetical protein EZ456_05030 [Pedobacter psychrodurus]|uniref:Uncharacterized protein n=1 Tax=Pedobacter psychrodurus TaxID=2530456 RepID=A0A4V2MRB1_9SPHI|nr:hypothetical protein [Pedobacter psychrodurus]TCD28747.1 hypothetical protein EZ456_05030 [Pedobacter psychrodurus]
MRKQLFMLIWVLVTVLIVGSCFLEGYAQRVVFDSRHFGIVNENSVVRNAAEMTHNEFLDRINASLKQINLNCATVVAAQTMIYEGLSNVNSALKGGLMVKNMAIVCRDILNYSTQMAELARAEPYLLLFAEDMYREMNSRAVRLFSEVSGFVLKSGSNILMDYGSRDALLRKINTELHILSGLTYGAWKVMYYAKIKGVFSSLNPFRSFISQDRSMVEDIIRNAKYLKR